MIVKFTNKYLEDLYQNIQSKGKPQYSQEIVEKFIATVNTIQNVQNSKSLYQFKSLHFEKLVGDRKGSYSVKINYSYRLEFRLKKDTVNLLEIVLIDDLTNHYQ